MKGRLWKHGITGALCVALTGVYCGVRHVFSLPLVEKYRVLCDGFTVPGFLCLSMGLLLWVGNDGFFYGLGYCLHLAKNALLPGRGKLETYYSYVTRHRHKPAKGYGFLFLWGSVCMTLAIAFLLLFYRLYP